VAAAEVSRADPVNRGTLPGLEKRETWGGRGETLSGRETAPLKPKNGLSGLPAAMSAKSPALSQRTREGQGTRFLCVESKGQPPNFSCPYASGVTQTYLRVSNLALPSSIRFSSFGG